jgi:hypothetical protein
MRFAVLAVAMVAAVPAQAQVRLAMGEEAVFTLDGGAPKVEARGPARTNGYEAFQGQEFASGKRDGANGATGMPMRDDAGNPATPSPQAGKIRVRFTPVSPQGQSMLVIENGYGQGLVYRATIHARGRSAPTDVCLVMPGKVGLEHWPFAIERIELGAFRLVDWKSGDPVPCA